MTAPEGSLRRSHTAMASLGLGLGPGRDYDFDKQQTQLRRNVTFVDSDEAWGAFLATSSALCGAFVLFRRRRCPACNHVAPKVWDASCNAHGMTEVAFVDVDVEACSRTILDLRIETAPSYQIYSHGKLRGTFTGVSISELSEHIKRMFSLASSCKPCGSLVSAASQELRDAIIANALTKPSQLEDLEGVCLVAYQRVPLGLSRVHFDFDSKLWKSPGVRSSELHERLSELPFSADPSHDCTLEFLAEVCDNELDVGEIWAAVHRWLTIKRGHASLWADCQGQLRQRLVNAALARRAARTELWLLFSLVELTGPSRLLATCAMDLRRELSSNLQGLRSYGRACLAQCAQCGLLCSAGPHGHSGAHDCLTDHQCHRGPLGDTATNERPRCLREAGHLNSCLFQQPAFQISAISMSTSLSSSSLQDTFAPLTALIPLEAPPSDMIEMIPCAICLDSLGSGGACVALPCGHSFHRTCTVEWIIRRPFCPLCRSQVIGTSAPSAPFNILAFSTFAGTPQRWNQRIRRPNMPTPHASQIADSGETNVSTVPSAHAANNDRPVPELPTMHNEDTHLQAFDGCNDEEPISPLSQVSTAASSSASSPSSTTVSNSSASRGTRLQTRSRVNSSRIQASGNPQHNSSMPSLGFKPAPKGARPSRRRPPV